MYVPSNIKMESTEGAHEFIDEFSFGVAISKSLEGTHLPFIGKLKLGQQRISEDQRGVVEGLQSVNSHKAQALVHYMLRKGVGIGS